ncbi:MAG: type I DNA topoisomerase [Ruminococcaceae bacterium]|nr:type I DNA topoisomerase [Oscillospiraceae bacterium]
MANLVIVESPSKATAIKKYLGSNYKVIASKGHVRDLPKSTLSVDVENGFEAHYINIRGKGDLIKEIRKEAKNAKKVFLAPDPDREGEAIAWHLANALGLDPEKTLRVSFNEITPDVVRAAIKKPRNIDMNLVNAQQTRRIWDRVVGYKLSPYLWKSVKNGLSAGRVQSVAARIIVDREEEIRAFLPEEYWTIDALLSEGDGKEFTVRFYGDRSGKIRLSDEQSTAQILNAVRGGEFTVSSVKRSVRQKLPSPPFTTSTMQQEASRKLGFQSQRIMRVAQELYEGINVGAENGGVQGLITYMRTDSLRVSADAQTAARELIESKYGEGYCPEEPRVYKTRAGAQDAHEAIRPSHIELEPAKIHKYLTPDQYKLYKLIWERFVASQMQSATLNTLSVELECSGYLFRASGYSVAFPGYMAVYEESEEEEREKRADTENEQRDLRIPELVEGERVPALEVTSMKHFTEPPARYTEASLIKFLDEKGIGRPSTYNTIITTIVARNYVVRDGKSLVPTPLGEVTTKLMKENFSDIVDYAFTAQMENRLDEIEKGNMEMTDVLNSFWKGFSEELSRAETTIGKGGFELPVEETDMICDKCGARMVVKNGRFGKFAACPNYPTCKSTKPLEPQKAVVPEENEETVEKKAPVVADFKCELCGADMVQRTGRYGSFFACSRYPACRFTKQKTKELDVPCPKCGSKVLIKTGRNKTVFYSCECYPECDFSSWDMPVSEKCPDCGKLLFRKKGKPVLVCHDKSCGYRREVEESAEGAGENE